MKKSTCKKQWHFYTQRKKFKKVIKKNHHITNKNKQPSKKLGKNLNSYTFKICKTLIKKIQKGAKRDMTCSLVGRTLLKCPPSWVIYLFKESPSIQNSFLLSFFLFPLLLLFFFFSSSPLLLLLSSSASSSFLFHKQLYYSSPEKEVTW